MACLSVSFLTTALLAILVHAQEPAYTGELWIEPLLGSAYCLTATSNYDGAAVTIEACVTGSSSQKWFFGNSNVRIYDDKCLDIINGVNADGTKLQIWTCASGDVNQQFYYTSDHHLAWTDHGRCVDLTGGNLSAGNRPQIWTCRSDNPNQVWNTGYSASDLPTTSEDGQTGTNNCGTTSSQDSYCQTAWINAANDFCLWAPPSEGAIGDTERQEVAWCTKSGRGTRVIPDGTLQGVHFVSTPDYVQVTGVGDFTKMNIPSGDEGGELDPHGSDSKGNPIGGLVFGNTFGTALQYHEWASFISYTEFCFRACVGANAAENCNHIYDLQGCYWNMPANYDSGVFEQCEADDDLPMGVYGTSTWYQGISPTPPAHPAASSSNCLTYPTIGVSPLR
ncbi:macrofage activating glyco protein [Fistulina hepatica ATCC 64428]|nr:macrofage activating glyco protein [Fistulina hepatica ATCC 64428]